MEAVLYVSHGSRVEKARSEALAFIDAVQDMIDVPLQQTCFLELSDPDVEQGLAELVKEGATSIAVIPVLLLSAGHYYQDIPEEIDRAKQRYPGVRFHYGRPLGVQDRLVDILVQRMEETGIDLEPDADILLVGRGSRNPETPKDIGLIARKLEERTGLTVNSCYLAACKPSFDEGLKASLKKGGTQTIVVPYLWFTGLLMQSMQMKINQVQQETDKQMVLCQYLGDHPFMKEALKNRVEEVLNPNRMRPEKVPAADKMN
ncbi:sirohydrochlorin chelatase [Sediminibacillus massiliensis]|uniref:sirohydrochlorin chelatase n=1 Tax=Sediminibacillus massiliensis TaxID=1926277 RepID=UPI0009883352|nr:sirohydrochlorin chelatase [Sediminibacillus massiliensis]